MWQVVARAIVALPWAAGLITLACPGAVWRAPELAYDHVSDWRDTIAVSLARSGPLRRGPAAGRAAVGAIRSAMLDCSMPPPEDGLTMSERERLTILEWIRCKMPR